jgi:DNA polymerase-3 subunit epsilon
MRYAALLDLETTGLDSSVDRVIEVGVCLYDLELGCPLESYAALIRSPDNGAEKINRIPVAALVDARHAIEVWRTVSMFAYSADVIAAHNAEFDRSFVQAAGVDLQKPWVCTMADFPWDGGLRKLVEIALHHGLGVATAHRAMSDVELMARILTRLHEMGNSLPELFLRAARPKKRFVAMVSYEMREVAKRVGFAWNGKEWWRMMPPEDVDGLSFRVVQRD